MPDEPLAKVCIVCGRDCSTRRREKRADGTYVCRECVITERRPVAPAAVAAPRAPAPPVEVEPESAPDEGVQCDICARRLPPGETYCGLCHYDARRGVQPGVVVSGRVIVRADLTCSRCGYDLHGLRQLRCPECSEPMAARFGRRLDEGYFFGLTRGETAVSLAMLGAGVFLTAGIKALAVDPQAAGAYLAGFVLAYLAGAGVFGLCSWMWLGPDFGWPAIALRLAGAFAVADLLAAALGAMLGISFLAWVAAGVHLDGERVPILNSRSGDLATVERMDTLRPDDLIEDWAVIEVPLSAPGGGGRRDTVGRWRCPRGGDAPCGWLRPEGRGCGRSQDHPADRGPPCREGRSRRRGPSRPPHPGALPDAW